MWKFISAAILSLSVVHLLANDGLSQVPAKNLRIAYSAISGSSFPLWIAKDANLFEKHGLSADLVYIPSSSLSLQAMLGGNIHVIATASAPTILQAKLQGADAILIGATSNTVTSFFMVTSDIGHPRDLKGKNLGVSRFGAFSDTVLRYALKKWGLEVGRDVTILQMGGIPEILAGMKAGLVSGGPLSPPTDLRARKEGHRELVDLGQILEYPQTCIAVSRRYLQASREEVRAYIRATIEAVHLMRTNKNLAMTVFGKYTRTVDKEILEGAYDTYVGKTEKVPYIKSSGTKVAIDLLAEKDPKFRSARPEDFIDNSVVKEIEDSGFVAKLYERKS
jgi:ABC-type nitrate/sulfonate/bicarbonate transport system substrate-binding protein